MTFLKDHPFAVESFFDTSLVLTYAVPKASLAPCIPECLSLDTFEDQWAFLAVAMVKTRALRPKGFPEFMGNDFILTGYRIFVKYITSAGKRLRGLYIVRSETDKVKMAFLGNIFTHYNYQQTDIHFQQGAEVIRVESKRSGLMVEVRHGREEIALPAGSPFKDWKEARRFAGPLPFTFTYNAPTKEVLIIEGVRETWKPEPVEVLQNQVGFIDTLALTDVTLANAFIIRNTPYYWKKGRKDLWTQA
jgi:uncharacterized protein YqjF (DUF2071 family)